MSKAEQLRAQIVLELEASLGEMKRDCGSSKCQGFIMGLEEAITTVLNAKIPTTPGER